MGICVSSQFTAKGGALNWSPSTAKVIHLDGSLLEVQQNMKASSILSLNPGCFLCNSESMNVNSLIPQVAGDEELQSGQIYFLIPLSKSQVPITLQDLCSLAVKASAALTRLEMQRSCSSKKSLRFSDDNLIAALGFTTGIQGCCKVPTGFDFVRTNSPGKASNQKIKL